MFERAVFVEDVSDAAADCRRQSSAAGRTEHDDPPAGHVFTTMVADAFDHGVGTPLLRTQKRSPAMPRI